MNDIKISYVVVARDINYVKVNDGDVKFAIVEPLTALEFASIPTNLKARVAFTSVGMTYGDDYLTFLYVFDPNGDLVLKKEKPFNCQDYESKPVVTTFVHDVDFKVELEGKYTFKAGIKDQAKSEYILYISKGVL